jgi:hypothetical protein
MPPGTALNTPGVVGDDRDPAVNECPVLGCQLLLEGEAEREQRGLVSGTSRQRSSKVMLLGGRWNRRRPSVRRPSVGFTWLPNVMNPG